MLLRTLCAATRRLPAARALATSATPSSISSILSSGAAASPLKDAVKFLRPDDKATTWTFRELNAHVGALTTGLSELGFQPGERVVSTLAPHTPEHVVLLLAAARLNLTLVALPGGADPANSAPLLSAIEQHDAAALFVPGDDARAGGAGAGGDVVAGSNSVLDAVAPGAALADAAGRAGMTPLSGRCARVAGDGVRLVVHAGTRNVRGAASFRSLLVYAGGDGVAAQGGDAPLLVAGAKAATQREVVDDAVALGGKLGLAGDHSTKNGKLVVTPGAERKAAAGGVAALLHQALWVCPDGPDGGSSAAQLENALVA